MTGYLVHGTGQSPQCVSAWKSIVNILTKKTKKNISCSVIIKRWAQCVQVFGTHWYQCVGSCALDSESSSTGLSQEEEEVDCESW